MDTFEKKHPIVMENYYAVKCLKVNFPTRKQYQKKVCGYQSSIEVSPQGNMCVRLGSRENSKPQSKCVADTSLQIRLK